MKVTHSQAIVEMWAIYDHPKDNPEHFVVRRWESTAKGIIPQEATLHDSLEEARASLPEGLWNLGRYDRDDPKIVEVWI